jgi:hypothetical protein
VDIDPLNKSDFERGNMVKVIVVLLAVVSVAGVIALMEPAALRADDPPAPIFLTQIPPGYRDWKMIAVDHLLTGKVDQLRAQLGNEIAVQAFKKGKTPFPDGTIIAALHWNRVPSEGNNSVLSGPFPGAQSFVVGSTVNVQFMVKDSKKYEATGGWGFGDFADGKPGDETLMRTCFPCHSAAKSRDYVFTRYAP